MPATRFHSSLQCDCRIEAQTDIRRSFPVDRTVLLLGGIRETPLDGAEITVAIAARPTESPASRSSYGVGKKVRALKTKSLVSLTTLSLLARASRETDGAGRSAAHRSAICRRATGPKCRRGIEKQSQSHYFANHSLSAHARESSRVAFHRYFHFGESSKTLTPCWKLSLFSRLRHSLVSCLSKEDVGTSPILASNMASGGHRGFSRGPKPPKRVGCTPGRSNAVSPARSRRQVGGKLATVKTANLAIVRRHVGAKLAGSRRETIASRRPTTIRLRIG
jgi:hypothetical protein